MALYAYLIILLPLLAFAIQMFFGKRLPRGGDFVSVTAVLLTFAMSLAMMAMMFVLYDPSFTLEHSFQWIDIGEFRVDMGVFIDNVTIIMLFVVALISSLVHIYSIGYMEGDKGYHRYFGFLSLFTFSMNGLVLSSSFFSIFIFWELVGLSSYLLIGFWFEKDSASDAGKKAFLVNRIGDIGMLIGIMLIWSVIGSFNFQDVFSAVEGGALQGSLLTIAGIMVFLGAIGKSAQFPLHVWLPDAMEGPTPVSALIHAATMVAAGVYLTVRIFPILTVDAQLVIAYIGGFTAIFAAIIAVTQNDIKRVLAYSTVSQLGYMIMALGVGHYVAGFFHLVTHASFKALLFLGSGSVIHAMHHGLDHAGKHNLDPQDMRNMGGLRHKMPVTYITFLIATLAISGIPFTSGFISKDAVLSGSLAFALMNPAHFLLPVFGFGAAILTAFYMFRQVFMTFHGKPAHAGAHEHIQESPQTMMVPLGILATLSLFMFYVFPSINPFSSHGWFEALVVKPGTVAGEHAAALAEHFDHALHTAHLPAIIISITVALTGILLAWLFYQRKKLSAAEWAKKMGPVYRLSFNKFYMDEIYSKGVVKPFLRACRALAIFDMDWYDKVIIDGFAYVTRAISRLSRWIDDKIVDGFLVNGVGKVVLFAGSLVRLFQTGRLQHYVIMTLFGIIIIFAFLVF
ncbi:MAG: NADH-quinone oxidoreductase subunit L [Candidatus Marinimicrobia bacterium]|nr:NADH-quinone oxidoreductase subunit L [Candidatus Neomarinimicrobiota bacterium]MCF7829009.1 NADH-quinone oxidoreductase subunit L [Candidatus Neomarinimicrobiota bacterium]MCF7879969.1 NADH-quinone oxidoreductase subunit L [Candidatus Neomarinimicrobiota bacterium]